MPEFDLDAAIANEAARTNTESGDNQNNSGEPGDGQQQNGGTPPNKDNQDGGQPPLGEQQAGAPAPQNQQADTTEIDYSKLELISGGIIKSAEDFQTIKESQAKADALAKEFEEYKAKPVFADESDRVRNDLKLSGATKEQLKAFDAIQDAGDISTLEDREALIMHAILVGGLPKRLAEAQVDKDYPLEATYDETDKELLEHKMSQSAKEAITALEAYKVEVSTPDDSALLKASYNEVQHKNEVESFLTNFKSNLSTVTTLNLNGLEGDQAITLDVSLDESGKSSYIEDMRDFLIANKLQSNEENNAQAKAYADAEYIKANLSSISQKSYKQGVADTAKLYIEKYENQGGLPRGDRKPGAGLDLADAALKNLKNEMMGGPLR